jgi:hypothetical protein
MQLDGGTDLFTSFYLESKLPWGEQIDRWIVSQEHAHHFAGGTVHNSSWQAKQLILHTTTFYGNCVKTLPRTLSTTHGLTLSFSPRNLWPKQWDCKILLEVWGYERCATHVLPRINILVRISANWIYHKHSWYPRSLVVLYQDYQN